jgi:hypothetical protein
MTQKISWTDHVKNEVLLPAEYPTYNKKKGSQDWSHLV